MPFGNKKHIALASFWFGQFFLWQPLTTIIVQHRVADLFGRGHQGSAVGILIGIGGVIAMTVPPFVGLISDRMNTRWGKRRPLMVAGSVLAALGILMLGVVGNWWGLVFSYALIQFATNISGAAYSAIIPDVVPKKEFGKASGLLGGAVQVGSALGLGMIAFLGFFKLGKISYPILALVILLVLIPSLWAASGERQTPVRKTPWKQEFKSFLGPLWGGDFGWVVISRALIACALASVIYFLFFFFRDVVGVAKPYLFTPLWFLLVLLFATPFGILGGAYSDNHGRKKMVYIASVIMASVSLGFAIFFPHALIVVLILGCIFGAGYGFYYAVDWALACDTLPDSSHAAKDMGLFHSALTFPQAVVPLLGGAILDFGNHQGGYLGFRLLFIQAVIFLLLGTLALRQIKGIK